jgi:hypothetical protein
MGEYKRALFIKPGHEAFCLKTMGEYIFGLSQRDEIKGRLS